jgi:hypothetical protein
VAKREQILWERNEENELKKKFNKTRKHYKMELYNFQTAIIFIYSKKFGLYIKELKLFVASFFFNIKNNFCT